MTLIGVDESGTGAWAGPFVVCACAFVSPPPPGLKDSKKLSDKRRFELTAQLLSGPAETSIQVVSPDDIRRHGQQEAWELAVLAAVRDLRLQLTSSTTTDTNRVVIDGKGSRRLADMLRFNGIDASFEPGADNKYPEVSAASIVAKTERNIRMRELAASHPAYGWDKNSGYGTPEHITAIREHGKTPHHRPCATAHPARKKKAPWT